MVEVVVEVGIVVVVEVVVEVVVGIEVGIEVEVGLIVPLVTAAEGEKMPTKKISDEKRLCSHPEHHPPSHMVYEPGTYEHTCPSCGQKITFVVHGTYR